jgi:MFS family permease
MYLGSNYVVLLTTAILLGGAANPTYSLLVAYANDYLEQDQMAAAAGGLLFINGFGAMTGPVIVGYAMTHLGIEWYFITLFLLLSSISLYGIYRISKRAHRVNAEPAPYLPISARSSGLATSFALSAAEEAHLEKLEDAEEDFERQIYDDAAARPVDEGASNSDANQR